MGRIDSEPGRQSGNQSRISVFCLSCVSPGPGIGLAASGDLTDKRCASPTKKNLHKLVLAALVLAPVLASAQPQKKQPPRKVNKTASSGRSLTQDIVPLRPDARSKTGKARPAASKAGTTKRAMPKRAPLDEKERKVFALHKKRAEGGSASSQYEVGSRYVSGKGVGRNRAEAIKWLEKALKQGNRKAAGKLHLARQMPVKAPVKTSAKTPAKPPVKRPK